jgi:hypothetical protein
MLWADPERSALAAIGADAESFISPSAKSAFEAVVESLSTASFRSAVT